MATNTRKAHLEAQLATIKAAVQMAVADVEPHPFGHAFLWGTATVHHKNGSPKAFRMCFGGVCARDLQEVVRRANSVPGVSDVYYNMD